MFKNYIKVTEKDKKPVVVLVANRAFYEKRGAKIEEPTKKEIEEFFPEERKGKSNETKQDLDAAHAELEKVKQSLEEAQKQIEKLSKNSKL